MTHIKKLILRLLVTPMIAYGLTFVCVAVLGTIYDVRQLQEVLGGTSALPIFLHLCWVVAVLQTVLWIRKIYNDKKDTDNNGQPSGPD